MATLTLSKIEDREGFGACGECGREGLRWIATLSDGSTVGLECSKKVLGFKPAPKTYNWVPDFRPVAEFNDCGNVHVMWQHREGSATRETLNGNLVQIGGVATKWRQRGWVV